MKIITLTLSPAFDVHCHVEAFAPYRENLATVTSRDAGGKGVNISRALCANGVENTAVVVLGEENAADFRRTLASDGIRFREILLHGRIRENITIHTEGADETRISFSGFAADESLLPRVLDAMGNVDADTVVTLTGRIPDGVLMQDVKCFLQDLRMRGARVVIDSKSFTLADLIECRPWLIKPNGEEIAEYLGCAVASFEEIREAAAGLQRDGIENVMISLGAKGAMLVCPQGTFVATPPRVEAVSTIGAGDSAIAGFLAGAARGDSPRECLRRAVAYGSAACMREGTNPPTAEDVRAILDRIELL